MSNFEDWENIIHFGIFFGSVGKKIYFLALGTTPVKGVGFIAGKITVHVHVGSVCQSDIRLIVDSGDLPLQLPELKFCMRWTSLIN